MKSTDEGATLKNSAHVIYPFFLVHMLGFGSAGFYMAYGDSDVNVVELYIFNGFAIYVYIKFYTLIFGRDAVKWIIINSLLGLYGIYTEIDWILSFFGKYAYEYPVYVHLIPFTYYVLYTFMLRKAVLDLTNARVNEKKKKFIEQCYIAVSILVYTVFYFV